MKKIIAAALFLVSIAIGAVEPRRVPTSFAGRNLIQKVAIQRKAPSQLQQLYQERGLLPKTAQGFDINTLLQRLRNKEQNFASDFYSFYFTVPRELIIKKRILAFLGNQLRAKGYNNISRVYQEPLLNYLGYVTQDKPVLAEFNPEKLVNNKTQKLFRQQVFGVPRRLTQQDFADIALYKPQSLNELITLVNRSIPDNMGGQMLVQLFVPKNMVDTIAQGRIQNRNYAIDQLMQSGPGLNKRLMNAQVFLNLRPNGDYRSVKFFVLDLLSAQERKKLDQQIAQRLKEVANQVIYAIEHQPLPSKYEDLVPPPVPPRDDLMGEVVPPLPPRDYENKSKFGVPPKIDRSTKPSYSMGLRRPQLQRQPGIRGFHRFTPQQKTAVAPPPVPTRDDLMGEVVPPLPPRDYENKSKFGVPPKIDRSTKPSYSMGLRRPQLQRQPGIGIRGFHRFTPQQKTAVAPPPVPTRDDLIDEAAPPLPPRDYENKSKFGVPPKIDRSTKPPYLMGLRRPQLQRQPGIGIRGFHRFTPQQKTAVAPPPVPTRDDLIDEAAPPLPPRDYEDEVAVIGVDSEDEFGEQEDSLRDVLAEGLASKFARIREAEDEEDEEDDFWQEEAVKWKQRAAEQKRRQEEAMSQRAVPSGSYVDPMQQMIKGFEQRFPQESE